MRTIVILISLAVSCYGSDDSPFTDLLKMISRDNSVKFNEHTNQHEDTSEEVFVLPNIVERYNSAPINELTNQLEGKDKEYFKPPKDHNLNHTCYWMWIMFFNKLRQDLERTLKFFFGLISYQATGMESQPLFSETIRALLKLDFCPMSKSRQNKATVVNEDDYPRLARVFHSPDMYHPFLCTAFAVRRRVFATAARCIATAKCGYTSVVYQKTIRMLCKALVFPPKPTRQLYNDIGFIVVNPKADVQWEGSMKLLSDFTFLDERRSIDERANTVVGYIADVKDPTQQRLYELRGVLVSNFLCNKIYSMADTSDDYYVPCFHTCSPSQYFSNDSACDAHMAGLGHAVFNENGTLIGVATWSCKNNAAYGQPTPLPVGLAVMAENAMSALYCAQYIRDDPEKHVDTGIHLGTYCKE